MNLSYENIVKAIRKKNYTVHDHADERSLDRRINLIPLIKAIPVHTQRIIPEMKEGQPRLNVSVLFHGQLYGVVWVIDCGRMKVITVFPYVPDTKYRYNPKDDYTSLSDFLSRAA